MTIDVHTPTPVPDERRLIRTMTSAVAQHLRNPLAGINGALHVLRGRTSPESEEWLIFGEMIARMRAVDESLDDLLDLTHPLKPKARAIGIAEIVGHCGRRLAEAGLGPIEVAIPSALEIYCDPALLQRAVSHLIRNGLELHAGSVGVTAREAENLFTIEVTDSGPGFANVEMIFEPFYTTKSRHLGLGLTIARRIARAHGGDVRCVETGAAGTLMVLTIPRVSAAGDRSDRRR